MLYHLTFVSESVFTALYFKEQLDSRHSRIVTTMTDYWTDIKKSLYSQAQMVVEEIMKRYPDGNAPIEWVNELNYYKSLMEQADKATYKYANWSSGFAYDQIGYEYKNAHDNARELIGMQNIGVLKGLAVPQIELLAGMTQATSPLGRLFENIGGEAGRKQISQALMNGLAQGMPMGGIANLMVESFNMPLARALLITRTEINRAYRASTLATYQTYGITKYKRMASQQRACMGCLLLDGQIYDSSHELDDHPNGACTMIPMVPGADEPEWEYGSDYFLGLSEEEQRKRMGNAYYESWQRGDFNLADLPVIKKDPVWGGNTGVKSLSELSPNWKSWFYGLGDKTATPPPSAGGGGFNPKPFLDQINNLLSDSHGTVLNKLKQAREYITTKLTNGQTSAVAHYTGNYFRDINNHLRSGSPLGTYMGDIIPNLREAIGNSPTNSEDILVYRGSKWLPQNLKEGDNWIDLGFTSTSINPANAFSGGNIEILIPKGSRNFAFVDDISTFQGENELLFNAGSIFKFLGYSPNGSMMRFVYAGNINDKGVVP